MTSLYFAAFLPYHSQFFEVQVSCFLFLPSWRFMYCSQRKVQENWYLCSLIRSVSPLLSLQIIEDLCCLLNILGTMSDLSENQTDTNSNLKLQLKLCIFLIFKHVTFATRGQKKKTKLKKSNFLLFDGLFLYCLLQGEMNKRIVAVVQIFVLKTNKRHQGYTHKRHHSYATDQYIESFYRFWGLFPVSLISMHEVQNCVAAVLQFSLFGLREAAFKVS